MKADRFNFHKKLAMLERAKVDLPDILAHSGQRYFQQEFQKSEWAGQAWTTRKAITKRNKGKHLLVNTGALKQSLQNTIISKNFKEIVWGVKSLLYAKYQNFGTATIPARKYLGGSRELISLLKKKINFQFSQVLHAK